MTLASKMMDLTDPVAEKYGIAGSGEYEERSREGRLGNASPGAGESVTTR